MTILGPVEFLRARYRPASRKGESFIPIEHQLGLEPYVLLKACHHNNGSIPTIRELSHPNRTSAWIDRRRPDTGRSQFIHGVPQQPDRS